MQDNDELRKRVAGMLSQATVIRDAQAELERLQTDGEAADGLVTVTVGPTGALMNVRIDPRAMRLDSTSLAEAILEAAQQATARAGEKAEEIFAGLGPSVDVASLMTTGTAGTPGSGDPVEIFERFQKLIS